MTTALTVVVLTCFAYLVLVNVVQFAFVVIGAFENAVRKHDAESNDFAAIVALNQKIRRLTGRPIRLNEGTPAYA
jgi:uncharacterized membrane protein